MKVANKFLYDGGLFYNNPAKVALSEANRMLPPTKIDFFISIGTGFSDALCTTTPINEYAALRPMNALYNAFLSHFDTQRAWKDMQCGLKRSDLKTFHRLDVNIGNEMLTLDDVEMMPTLESTVTSLLTSPATIKVVKDAADSILCSLFYLELDSFPKRTSDGFWCSGSVFAKLDGEP